MPGGGGKKSKGKMPKQAGRKAKKGRSGNPAKRAAQEAGQPAVSGGQPGGLLGVNSGGQTGGAQSGGAQTLPPDLSDLPEDLKKLLS